MKLPKLPEAALFAGGALVLYLLLRRSSGLLPPSLPPPVITEPPTLTRQAARILADVCFAAFYGSGGWWAGQTGEDEAAVIAALSQANNDADIALIVDEYGTRSGAWSVHGPLTLPAAITVYFDADQRTALNTALAGKGINFRF